MRQDPVWPTLAFIHGFLGRAADWDRVVSQQFRKVAWDLFARGQENQRWDLPLLAERVNGDASVESAPRVLIGYSLGGRIALHALLDRPQAWSGAVIISAHPGLSNPSEKIERIQSDEAWARRFETENWEALMASWNAQGVFARGDRLERFEEDFSRVSLAGALRGCSLGLQRDLRQELKKLDLPILWMVGEKDQKYLGLARDFANSHPRVELEVVAEAAHRVPWDRPIEFGLRLERFLRRLALLVVWGWIASCIHLERYTERWALAAAPSDCAAVCVPLSEAMKTQKKRESELIDLQATHRKFLATLDATQTENRKNANANLEIVSGRIQAVLKDQRAIRMKQKRNHCGRCDSRS